MKTIGLLGGMSWESTAHYYRLINTGIRERLGGLHSARIVMLSVDFQEIADLQADCNWQRAAELLAGDAKLLEAAGADFLLLCTNTMHKVAEQIQAALSIPLVHLADATASRLATAKVGIVGLLGTRFTMEEDFYRERIEACHTCEVLIPSGDDITLVHDIIFQELCRGVISDASRREYLRIIDDLRRRGAEGIILGCTEIGLLVSKEQCSIPLYDTTAIHADVAVQFALNLPSS